MQSSTQSSIQPSTLSSIQSSILPNKPPPRAGVIAGGFAEADAAGVVIGPFDRDLDERGAGDAAGCRSGADGAVDVDAVVERREPRLDVDVADETFVLGVERGMALIESQPGVDAVVVDAQVGTMPSIEALVAPPGATPAIIAVQTSGAAEMRIQNDPSSSCRPTDPISASVNGPEKPSGLPVGVGTLF